MTKFTQLGTDAPELWSLNLSSTGSTDSASEKPLDGLYGTVQPIQLPEHWAKADIRWGDASFVGPTHEIIVCEVSGKYT